MLLLDTHILLWIASDQSELTQNVKHTIHSNAGNLYVSSISAFEIAVKHRKDRLRLPSSPEVGFKKALALHGIEEITINSEILIKAALLPLIHNDPGTELLLPRQLLTMPRSFQKIK